MNNDRIEIPVIAETMRVIEEICTGRTDEDLRSAFVRAMKAGSNSDGQLAEAAKSLDMLAAQLDGFVGISDPDSIKLIEFVRNVLEEARQDITAEPGNQAGLLLVAFSRRFEAARTIGAKARRSPPESLPDSSWDDGRIIEWLNGLVGVYNIE